MEYRSKNVVQNAIERGELKECMMGMGKYEYSEKNFPGTFNEEEILNDFYSIYEDNPKLKADKIFQNTLVEMLNGNIKEIFAAIFYIYSQKYNEKKKISKFYLSDDIFEKVNEVVHKKMSELESTEGINELHIHQNIMKVLRNLNNRSIKELGLPLFRE
ncbi:MAG: hypothetical protein Q8876_09275 [Bacillota bacterium]|nr:hypothetical protein [Bacillota bacterium]